MPSVACSKAERRLQASLFRADRLSRAMRAYALRHRLGPIGNGVGPTFQRPSERSKQEKASMLTSMTGHGAALCTAGSTSVSAELRTINSRYLKIVVRASEGYSALEPRVEALIRKHIRRGTVQVQIQVLRQSSGEDYRIDARVLEGYRQQLAELKLDATADTLLGLPGVIAESDAGSRAEDTWELVQATIIEAVERLEQMRNKEGRNMEADLKSNCTSIAEELAAIAERLPDISEAYGDRLLERINKLLEHHGVQVEPASVVREVGLFAERSDVSEELVRLQSHLEQFDKFVSSDESNGRKLDFLVQEMYREANTVGSKANDVEIATRVVQIKSCIERMREMIQNIE